MEQYGGVAQDLRAAGVVGCTEEETATLLGLWKVRRMAEGKTGALMGCACAVGALFGGASPQQVQQLRGFGEHLDPAG